MSPKDLIVQVETGPWRADSAIWRGVAVALCLGRSAFQLYIADNPFDTWQARAVHLAFALMPAFLAYPAFKRNEPGRLHRALGNPIPGSEGKDFVLVYDAGFGGLLLALWTAVNYRILVSDLETIGHAYIPVYDATLGLVAAASSLFIVLDYEGPIWRQGLPGRFDVWVGPTCTLPLLEAARRASSSSISASWRTTRRRWG